MSRFIYPPIHYSSDWMESLWTWARFAFRFLPAAQGDREPALNRRARVSEAAGPPTPRLLLDQKQMFALIGH